MSLEGNNQSSSGIPASAAQTRPLARDIVTGLKDAEDPLEFIRTNLRQEQPQIDPNAVVKEVEEKRSQEAVAETTTEVPVPELNIDSKGVTENGVQEQEIKSEEQTSEEPEEGEEVKNTSAENFKKLRNIVKETKKVLAEKDNKLKETETKLQAYESGEVLPEALQAKEQRIAELERYEKILSLKTSPEYQEKYIRPITQIQEKLGEIAKDYNIPVDVMNKALAIDNRAELNRFVSSHFDDIGALEVKQLVEQAKILQHQAIEAEKEPETAIQRIVAEAAAAKSERRKQAYAEMSQVSRDAWIDSLLKIKEEGDAIELIHREGDTEYNNKFVNPVIKQAAQEYGKLVTMLAKNGLEKLPSDLAFALSRMCQLAHATGVAIHTRNEAVRRAEELETNVKRTTSYLRPQVGSSNGRGGVGSSETKAPSSPTEAAEMLLNKVLSSQ